MANQVNGFPDFKEHPISEEEDGFEDAFEDAKEILKEVKGGRSRGRID
jgi:hypothetical protein